MSADYVMVGGFLGAGKTTALLQMAQHFSAQGRRVGLITNDQSDGLVDTSIVQASGFPVAEITGGCFCCRFNSLTDAADRLTRDARPDVFLAEPVGSCTDLRATVQYPLRRLYGNDYRVAPLSVVVDPLRAERMLGLAGDRSFSPKVRYVFEKQLEEADIIVLNKRDLVLPSRLQAITRALQVRFPHATVVSVSARGGDNLADWFGRLGEPLAARPAMDVDYDRYAEGEALLGWVNAACRLIAPTPFDGNRLLRLAARGVQERLAGDGTEIAHLKMTLAPDAGGDLAVLNLVRTGGQPELRHQLAHALDAGDLLVNLRAEGDPDRLHAAAIAGLEDASRDSGAALEIVHSDHFRPGRPEPTHRMALP